MNKKLLSIAVMLVMTAAAFSQVSFFVEAPSSNEGGYEISFAEGTGWGVPDMTDPANVISGTMCLGHDSLACTPLTNGAELAGKIAVVYRGACEFGAKALAAQDAGAIAVIIINHSPGVIPMGGGASGTSVTIPVIMISNSDGATLYDEINNCNSTAIIGNLNGYFENNLRMTKGGTLRPASYGRIALLSENASEFAVETGAWVYNFGQVDESEGIMNLTVTLNGSEVYNETSSSFSVPVGDSIFVSMPTFDQATYAEGRYLMSYTVEGTEEDQFNADNISAADFNMGDRFSYSRLNDENKAYPTNYTSPATFNGEQNYCLFFTDPNASRVQVAGFDFSGTHFTDVIDDMDISMVVYEWGDPIDGLNTGLTSFDEIGSEDYTFGTGEEDAIISVDFGTPVELEDGLNYLFCLRHANEELQLGYDNKTDYTENVDVTMSPIFPTFNSVEGFLLTFGPDLAPAFSVRLENANSVAEFSNNVDVTPFPNPAVNMLTVPFNSAVTGMAVLNIFNVEGQLISSQRVNVNTTNLKVDVSNIANGSYVFNLLYDDAKQSTFNVVISR